MESKLETVMYKATNAIICVENAGTKQEINDCTVSSLRFDKNSDFCDEQEMVISKLQRVKIKTESAMDCVQDASNNNELYKCYQNHKI